MIQFLEKENVDTKELIEVKTPEKFQPTHIEVYDPNQPKEPIKDESKPKRIRIKKESKECLQVSKSVDFEDLINVKEGLADPIKFLMQIAKSQVAMKSTVKVKQVS